MTLSDTYLGNSVTAELDCITDVIATPNSMFSSGAGDQPKRAGVVHDVESPSGAYAVSLAQGWLRSGEPHSVQVILDGFAIVQLLRLGSWCWGAGAAVNTNTIQVEQAGYVTFTEAMWLGKETPGTTYQDSYGRTRTWTSANNGQMAAQLVNMATFIAQVNHHQGWGPPRWGTQDDMRRYLAGENVGCYFQHYDVSNWAYGTNHSDPAPHYPKSQLMTLANKIYGGTVPPPPPPKPPSGEFTMDAEAKAAIQALSDKLDKVLKVFSDATGDGIAGGFPATIKAILHGVQGDTNLDAQDLAVDKADLAQQQANYNALHRLETKAGTSPQAGPVQ